MSVDKWAIQLREYKMGSIRGLPIPALLEIIGEDYVDLLKLDIEGAEREVFRHSKSWIERVGTIVLELHDRKVPRCSDEFFHALEGKIVRFTRSGENIVAYLT